jgi:hypothetical protein
MNFIFGANGEPIELAIVVRYRITAHLLAFLFGHKHYVRVAGNVLYLHPNTED